ncbi:ABC transporter substrate-binding protein [Methyloversatilis thermotolerans]|uniref:ABC transporter substrate-binding protein n=1 Tax=Methyloversatilis thermotolerans TaxID=1346290 RepID=UPI0003697BC7|nr:ABC transporter substrate-binding protein [Methyloversatilis thermotolerans]
MVRLTLAAILLIGAGGCEAPPRAPLTVGLNPWIGYDPLVFAREMELVDRDVLKVVELESTADSARQLRNGLIDAAGLTLPEAIELAATGTDIRIVAILSQSKGGDAVIAAPHLRQPSDLRGVRLGLEDTALASTMLARLSEEGRLRSEELTLVYAPAVMHEDMMRRGQVDAVITFEPVISRLLAAGFSNVLDSAHIQGEVIDVLVVRGEVAEARWHDVTLLLSAFDDGRRALLSEVDAAAGLLAPGLGLSAGEYLDALKGIRLFSAHESRALIDAAPSVGLLDLERVSADLKAAGRLMADPDWNDLFDKRLPAAAGRSIR